MDEFLNTKLINSDVVFKYENNIEISWNGSATFNVFVDGKNVMDLNINLVHKSGTNVPVQFSALLKGKNWYWFMKHAALTVA